MNLLIGSLTIGFILSLLALGVYVTFRIFNFADITADGSIALGASVTAVLLVKGFDPLTATLVGTLCGATAGTVTGILHTRFKINSLLSGILVMTALYSVNLRVMGRSNVPLLTERTLATYAEELGMRWFGAASINLAGWETSSRDVMALVLAFLALLAACTLLYAFFRTHLGTAMRATGDNPQMIRALGVNTNTMIVLDIIGYGAIPLLILSFGYSLTETKLPDFRSGLVGGLLRVVVGPILAFGLVFFFRHVGWLPMTRGYDPLVFLDYRTTEAIIILGSAMPGPIMAYMLNVKFNSCPREASAMLTVSTLAGIVTIPIVLQLINVLVFGKAT